MLLLQISFKKWLGPLPGPKEATGATEFFCIILSGICNRGRFPLDKPGPSDRLPPGRSWPGWNRTPLAGPEASKRQRRQKRKAGRREEAVTTRGPDDPDEPQATDQLSPRRNRSKRPSEERGEIPHGEHYSMIFPCPFRKAVIF